LLKLAPGQPVVSGLDVLDYLEMWNEQDKWWKDIVAFYSPYEYSAMLSADYDGHGKTLGTTVGVKNADPTMKVVMGGIEEISLDYIRAMKLWVDFNRPDQKFPADVVNMHYYCSNGDTGKPPNGICPEDCKFKELFLPVRDWLDRYLPGIEFWVSEFGYDSNSASPQGVPSIGSTNNFVVQAQWLVRSYLALATARVDRAHQYWLTDENDLSSYGRFETSGMIDNKNNPKPAWFYVYTMKNRLANMRFINDSINDQVNVAKFASDDRKSATYVVWSGTAYERLVPNHYVQIEGNPSKVIQVTLTNGQTNGVEEPLTVNAGMVVVTVSETPLFIVAMY